MGVKNEHESNGNNDNELVKNMAVDEKTKWFDGCSSTAIVSKKYRMPATTTTTTADLHGERLMIAGRKRPHLTLFAIVLNFGIFMCLLCYLLMGAFSLTVTEQYQYGQQHSGHDQQYTQLILNAHQKPQAATSTPATLKVPNKSSSSSSTTIIAQQPSTPENNWRLSEAFLYCLLLLTTTGMPNISLTFAGKLITTVFIALGVPLMILFLAMVGSLGSKLVRLMFCDRYTYEEQTKQQQQQQQPKQLAASITPPPITLIEKLKKNAVSSSSGAGRSDEIGGDVFSVSKPANSIDSKLFCVNDIIGRDVQTISTKPTQIETKITIAPNLPSSSSSASKTTRKWHLNYLLGVLLFFSMYSGFLSCGYLILRTLDPEFWTFFECFYFSFLTLTTISFGSEEERMKIFEAGHQSDFVFWFCTAYVLTGLSLLSTFFYVINDEFLQFF